MNKLRVAVVGLGFGLGYMKQVHSHRSAGHEWVEVAAVCDASPERLASGMEAFGCPGFHSLDELLAQPGLDAVALFSGPVGRADLIRRILRTGRHVMTTKPFELDPAAARTVLQEAAKMRLVVHLNSPSPLPGENLQQIRRWQSEHDMGRCVSAQFSVWANYREAANQSWYDDPALCPVAPIFRLGIYALNDILGFMSEPESVQVAHSRLFTGRPTPDHASLTVRFRGGALANVFASFCIDDGLPYANRLQLQFERGSAQSQTDANSQPPRRCRIEGLAPGADGPRILGPAYCAGESSSGAYQWENFYRAVRGEHGAPQTPIETVTAGIAIINAMRRAEQSGRTEQV